MSLSTSIIWEVRPSGVAGNAGGFNPANANFPTDLAATTNTGNTATPEVSSASYNFVAGDVGAYIFVKSGTNWVPGWYKITSVASNKATVDAAIGKVLQWNKNSSGLPEVLNTAIGIATVVTPTAGTWGIDYSQQDSAEIAFTDMVIDGTTNTKFTSSANPVGKNFTGNHIAIASGTGFTVQTVEVVSTSGTTATCDKSLGTLSSTGGTGKFGGGLPDLSYFTSTSAQANGQTIFVKGPNTYAHSAQIAIQLACTMVGYGAVRGDGGATPVIRNTFAGACFGTIAASPYTWSCAYLDFDGNSVTSSTLNAQISGAAFSANFSNCAIHHYASDGGTDLGSSTTQFVNCSIYSNGGIGWNCSQTTTTLIGCVIRDNGGAGAGGHFSNESIVAKNCIFARNGGFGIDCYSATLDNCLFHSNTGTAIGSTLNEAAANGLIGLRNTIVWNNGGYGVSYNFSTYRPTSNVSFGVAMGSNSSGDFKYPLNRPPKGFVALTVDPCVNAAGNDFSLNNTAGGGAACRAAGIPGAFPGSSTSQYLDIGAAQHQDAGVGGTTFGYIIGS